MADTAFGSIEMLEKITTWGGSATLSCPQTVMPWIWELLSHNWPPSHWCAAKLQSSNIIASLHAGTDHYGKITYQQILSIGWTTTPKHQVSITGVISEMPRFENLTTLLSMKKDELHDMSKKYHIKVGKNKQQYVDNIKERSLKQYMKKEINWKP